MAIQASNKVMPSNVVLTVPEVRDRLNSETVRVMRDITTDSERRKSYGRDPTLLKGGIFYPEDYFNALTGAAAKDRLDWFVKRNSFFHGYACHKHFDMLPNPDSPSGVQNQCYVLKQGILPSKALNAIKIGPSLLDCGSVCQIAYYSAVEKVLGSERFNALFARGTGTPLMISTKRLDNPIFKLRSTFNKEAPPESEITQGVLVYIKNVEQYLSKHPLGDASGYNAICVNPTIGSQTFLAFGFPAELTHAQIQERLISDCNSPFTRFDSIPKGIMEKLTQTPEGRQLFESANYYKNTQISKQQFTEFGGGKMTSQYALNAERITALANSTLPQARKLLDSYPT